MTEPRDTSPEVPDTDPRDEDVGEGGDPKTNPETKEAPLGGEETHNG